MSTSTFTAESAPARAERDSATVDLLTRAARARGPERQQLLDRAVELNIEMARRLAFPYFRRGIPHEDLEQVACLALVKAARGFDPLRSERFAAYAIPTIRGELRRHFRDAGWTVRPPRRIQELRARVREAEAVLAQQLDRPPTVEELADAVGAEIADVREVADLSTCFCPTSIDAPASVSSHQTLGERLPATDSSFSAAEARLVLAPLVAGLSQRDRRIIQLRFVEQLTQQEIGSRLDISQMQISRILTDIYARLRVAVGEVPTSSAA